MSEILVLAEHRKNEIRDITFEMLTLGRRLARQVKGSLTAVLIGYNVKDFCDELANYADQVILVEDERVKEFNSEAYQKILMHLIRERKPLLILIGHTSYGMDLAPSLSTALNIPLSTNCINLEFRGGKLVAVRQFYGGKVNAEILFREAESYMATIRPGALEAEKPEPPVKGSIVVMPSPLTDEDVAYKKFIQYIEEAKGEVDITTSDIIVAVGRGIKDAKNMPMIEEFAKAIGGVVAGSRPVVDKGWLPKERQVGISGKTVKPKLYIAVGISGAFQHITGIKGKGIIVAINKDPKAPIFRVADYGIVDDLFKVIPALKEKISELKT